MAAAAKRGMAPRQLRALARRLSGAHPAMASVWNAVGAPEPVRFIAELEHGLRATVRLARSHLRRGARVVTLSYSSTVVAALSRGDLRVVVAESRPGGEGAITVRRLRRKGVKARLIADAEIARALEDADCGMVGADAVTPRWVINKVGTTLLALAARAADVPCYVLADPSKRVGSDWPLPDPTTAPRFERTAVRLVTAVVTPDVERD